MKNKTVYFREMALNGFIVNVDYSYLKKHTTELQRIGRNLNQITKRVNLTGNVYQEDLQTLTELMEKVWQLQRSILSKAP